MSIFAYDNIMTRDTTNLSLNLGDANASYPLDNLTKVHLSKVYRSVSGTQTVKILIDAAEPVSADIFMIRTDNGFGLSSLTIKGNSSNSFTSPPFSQTINTLSDTYNFGYQEFSSTQTYRYWELEAVSTGSFVQLVNIYLGLKLAGLDDQDFSQGWVHNNVDTSTFQQSEEGQRYYNERPDMASITASMALMNESETTAIDALFEFCGTTKPIWLIPLIDNSIKYSSQYYFTARPQWKQDRYRLHSTNLSLIEVR